MRDMIDEGKWVGVSGNCEEIGGLLQLKNMEPQDEDKMVWDRKLFWKVMKWVGIFLFSFYLILILVSYFGPDIQSYLNKKTAENYFKKIEAEEKELIELAKADTYGGKTPEETLDLYIEALKKGDVELASKYSRVDQWEEALLDLNKAKQKDNLAFAVKFATSVHDKGKKTCSKQDYCYFLYEFITEKKETFEFGTEGDTLTVPAGSKDDYSLGFELSKFSNLWKIVRP